MSASTTRHRTKALRGRRGEPQQLDLFGENRLRPTGDAPMWSAVPAQNSETARKPSEYCAFRHTVVSMVTVLSALLSLLSFRFRGRASLELELIALRHQVTVLRRQRPGRPRLFSTDRLLWVWLYRIWPQVLNTMVLVKPATVVQWHRKGFRLYWRRRSRRLGGPGWTARSVI